MKIAIIGGGAAGFFAALTAKEANPKAEVHLFERSNKLLAKVRLSGGGRCNVTHACFDPKALVLNYPRGHKELLGPFHRFQPQDTIAWFESRGVPLKEEADGRMFPLSNSSETIISCFVQEAKKLGVHIHTQATITAIDKGFFLHGPDMAFDRLILTTGSSRFGWEVAKQFGHTIQSPVPSLFTFNIPNFPLEHLSGVSLPHATLTIAGTQFLQTGPLLITHWGFSGPVALKLSAFAARYLAEKNYHITLQVNWHPDQKLPKRLFKTLQERETCFENDPYTVSGKTTNKAEFVTCGGITLSEVNFKTLESKRCPNLFFAGEILDIDGITGGFNFQNAWTTAHLAGTAAANHSNSVSK
ncbi:MAG: aminoacetone oxidase family FAD-binding enzyme [Chlamydiia bacterium]|nr:aminoacetone oxidase family FAD-binding enzyme [Chlamydiia bacterium]